MRSALLGLSFCIVAAAWADTPAPATAAAPAIATVAPITSSAAPADAPAAASTAAPASAPPSATSAPPQTSGTASASDVYAVKTPSCEEIKAFKSKMHAAVDDALKYPADLKFEPAAGVTIVTYDYEDGHTLNPHITQWSGDGRLDRAALNAVKNADFASITPGIGRQHIHDAVIIVFDNSANIDKNAVEQPKKKDPAAEPCGG